MSQTKSRSRTRRIVAAAAAVAATAGVVAAGAGSASADTNFTIHITPNSSFGLLLDVSGASQSPAAGVIQWYANGGANQVWSFYSFGGNTYEIVNANSGQCLNRSEVDPDSISWKDRVRHEEALSARSP